MSKNLKTHCVNGHALEGDNLRVAKNGQRKCAICTRIYRKKSKKKITARRNGYGE